MQLPWAGFKKAFWHPLVAKECPLFLTAFEGQFPISGGEFCSAKLQKQVER